MTGIIMSAGAKRTSKEDKGTEIRRKIIGNMMEILLRKKTQRMMVIKGIKRRMRRIIGQILKIIRTILIMALTMIQAGKIDEIRKEIREEGTTKDRGRVTIIMICTMIKGDKITDSRGKFKINHRNGTNLVNKIILAIRKMKENKSRITKQRKSPKHPKTMNMKNSEGHSNPSGLLGR